jgi:HAD superfamily hydrolase (TIGR01509 family)
MRTSLGKAGLLHLVEHTLFSAEQVAQGKPAPDLFLFAARTMGAAPGDTVVIEDSVPGVLAGVAADMRVLGYVGDPLTDAAGLRAAGAELFDDMAKAPTLI